MPFQLDATGKPRGDLADRGELRLLRDHVRRVLAQMADDMAGGTVEPNPIVRGPDEGSCTYCDFAQVCHRASGEIPERPIAQDGTKDLLDPAGKGGGIRWLRYN